MSLEQTALFFSWTGRIEERARREKGKKKSSRNGRREISNNLAPCSVVLLDGNGAVAGCRIVPVHQALQWLYDVPVLVHF